MCLYVAIMFGMLFVVFFYYFSKIFAKTESVVLDIIIYILSVFCSVVIFDLLYKKDIFMNKYIQSIAFILLAMQFNVFVYFTNYPSNNFLFKNNT